jgi:hypothetical protein
MVGKKEARVVFEATVFGRFQDISHLAERARQGVHRRRKLDLDEVHRAITNDLAPVRSFLGVAAKLLAGGDRPDTKLV